MDNVEIDDSEFFHQDFTTASEWEIFTARIEEILHEWKITNAQLPNVSYPLISEGKWKDQTETLFFADVEFKITYYYLEQNEATIDEDADVFEDTENEEYYIFKELEFSNEDFATFNYNKSKHGGLSLARIYGLHKFLVLSPTKNVDIDNESKVKILISTAHLAINNSNCEIPFFVMIGESSQQLYLGVHESRGLCTNFDMIHLERGPQHGKYLTGLLDVFKSKIASPLPLSSIMVSAQFSYELVFMNKLDLKSRELIAIDDIGKLQFGACIDPFNQMTLLATWQNLPENLIIDSQNYSDFDPQQAASWSIKIKMDPAPPCFLVDSLLAFIRLINNNKSISDVLGDYVSESNNDTANALSRITESKVSSFTSVLRRATVGSGNTSRKRNRSVEGLVSEEFLIPILCFLFPDAEEESQRPYTGDFDNPPETGALKSCSFDSLLWRLAIVLVQNCYSMNHARSIAHIWYEFVQEMRFRWEQSIKIPGLSPGFPDFRTCLLHQKLQLLNCCIDRKVKREERHSNIVTDEQNVSTDSDDEFFDCEADEKQKYSLWNEPVGRQTKFGTMKLIETGDPLYIPITQEAVPKTEDQLEEDADFLVQLGDGALASELRARMMSASLLSDMESFKAANPNAIFEDFIRWYSPRDWIDEENTVDKWGQPVGHLSSRMQIKDNTWIVVWESAKPVPARRQKRLFDDTLEAEKVLHYLEACTLSDVCELLLPVLTHVALYYIIAETQKHNFVELITLPDTVRHLVRSCETVSRDSHLNIERYKSVYQKMGHIESTLSYAKSLRRNFYEVDNKSSDDCLKFFTGLLKFREIEVPGGPHGVIGDRISKMFHDIYQHLDIMNVDDSTAINSDDSEQLSLFQSSTFPAPEKKEYVMRVMANRPAPYSKLSPQFMRTILTKDDFRMAGAFTHDTQFF